MWAKYAILRSFQSFSFSGPNLYFFPVPQHGRLQDQEWFWKVLMSETPDVDY